MALSSYPIKTKFQANTSTAWFIDRGLVKSALVIKTDSEVSYASDGVTGQQINIYTLDGYSRLFQEVELFISKAECLYTLSGGYLSTMNSVNFQTANFPISMPYSSMQISDFTADVTTGASNFEGCDLTSSDFTSANLNLCSFVNANLTSCILTSATIATADFRGANLHSATLGTAFDIKSEFRALVGATRYDPITTLWTDGLPIG